MRLSFSYYVLLSISPAVPLSLLFDLAGSCLQMTALLRGNLGSGGFPKPIWGRWGGGGVREMLRHHVV